MLFRISVDMVWNDGDFLSASSDICLIMYIIFYKNKTKVRKPKEEWIRIENTHEAIIAKDIFYHVQN